MEIKVLGTGCPKCKRLEALAREVAGEMGVEATITKVKEVDEILTYDILSTPGLVIEGDVKSAGRIPRKEEIADWIREAQGS